MQDEPTNRHVMKWLSERDLVAPGMRLFCLPHAGSGSAGFHRWKRLLAPHIAVCPVMLPGREVRLAEAPLERVTGIVDQLQIEARAYLDRPYAIFGHSMGSLLAYEWTQRIVAEGLRAPEVLFISGRNAPQWPPGHMGFHALDDAALASALQLRYGGTPKAWLNDAEMREIFLPILRADLAVVETYRHEHTTKLQCPVVALAGEADGSVSNEGLKAWEEIAADTFAMQRIAGDHFYPFDEGQSDVLKLITDTLAA